MNHDMSRMMLSLTNPESPLHRDGMYSLATKPIAQVLTIFSDRYAGGHPATDRNRQKHGRF